MNGALLLIAVTAPLLVSAASFCPPLAAPAERLVPYAALPALALTLSGAECHIEIPWLLLGAQWGLDTTGRVFLAFTASLWLAAGVYARDYLAGDPQRRRFELAWLLAMAGNLGLIVAGDMLSFLLFFTLMSLAAYGLVVHDGRRESLRAGRCYMILVVLGEISLFWAAVLAARETGQLQLEAMAAGLVLGAGSLAGLPLTAGYVAKKALAGAAAAAGDDWAVAFAWLLPVSALTTSLLLCRFLYLAWPAPGRQTHAHSTPAMVVSWAALLLALPAAGLCLALISAGDPAWSSLAPRKLWAAGWPPLLAAAASGCLWWWARRDGRSGEQAVEIPHQHTGRDAEQQDQRDQDE